MSPDVVQPAAATSAAPQHRLRDFAAAWKRGERPRAADWLRTMPPAEVAGSFAIDLAYEEYCQRAKAGDLMAVADFCQQFPGLESNLARLISVHQMLGLDEIEPPGAVEDWPDQGDELLGFRLGPPLGRGTFSRVFLADDLHLKRRVVVKVCRDQGLEAKTLARLEHPHIVPVFSAPSDPFSGFTAICLPYQGQVTLAQALTQLSGKRRSELRGNVLVALAQQASDIDALSTHSGPRWTTGSFESAVVRLGMHLADGLAHAHELQIVHGDLKPSNVLLDHSGQPLLLDFNLAIDQRLEPVRVGGTLPYMPPELLSTLLAQDEKASLLPTPQGDVFALGVVLYELATGRYPFGDPTAFYRADNLHAAALELREMQRAGPTFLPSRQEGVSARFAEILLRCLAYDPAARPSAAALRDELARELRPIRRSVRWAQRQPQQAMALASLGAIALALGTWAYAQQLPPAQRDLARGKALLAKNQWADAEPLLISAAEGQKEDWKLRQLLGFSRFQQGKYELALSDFQKLETHAPELAPWELMGHCAHELNYGAEPKLRYLEQATQPSPQGLNDQAFCRLQLSQRELAKPLLDAAVAALPEAQEPILNRLHWAAGTLVGGGTVDVSQVRADGERALQIGPDHAEIRRALAVSFSLLAKQDPTLRAEALEHLTKALELGLDPGPASRSSILKELLPEALQQAKLPEIPTAAAPPARWLLPPVALPGE